jgi:hypothetical protein
MKAYRDLMQYRSIPIGYAAADIADVRFQTQDYFSCGSANTSVDFFAFNRYSWCGSSTMAESGYDTLYSEAEGYDVPIFLSETGCNTGGGNNDQRTFSDQTAMLGQQMNEWYSGNIIYEWAQEENNYGLVSYSSGGAAATPSGTPKVLVDYNNLQSQWATLNPSAAKASAYDPTLTKRACPAFTSSGWLVAKDATIPTLGISGFTAPTTPRSTPTTSPTGTGGGAENAAKNNTEGPNKNPSRRKKTPVGAIAGGVLGGLVVLALILAGVLVLLRRKQKQREATEKQERGTGAAHGPSDKMVVTEEQQKTQQNGFYGPSYHELNGQGATQELDPARGQVAPMPAPELSSQRGPVEGDRESPPLESAPTVGHTANAEPSPFVQRQRNMEMEWLESEEARLRERRELLRRQNGGAEAS